jgi:hypothetical protein
VARDFIYADGRVQAVAEWSLTRKLGPTGKLIYEYNILKPIECVDLLDKDQSLCPVSDLPQEFRELLSNQGYRAP